MAVCLWALAVAAGATASDGGIVLRPSWRPGQVLTYRLTRHDVVEAGSELERTYPRLGGTTSHTLTLRVLSQRTGGGIEARLGGMAGETGTGEVLFNLDRRLVRRAAHSWRTFLARRGSDGPGSGYEVTMGHVETTITLDLVPGP